MIYIKRLIFIILIVTSCQSIGQLKFEADIVNELKEVSAVELDATSHIRWIIEDAGNSNDLFGLDKKGQITRRISVSNAKNKDWEDLTIDTEGNIYIGDFGNNNEHRKKFKIYKINHSDLTKDVVTADIIEFTLPEAEDSRDFEAFFIYNKAFYIFSKETKKFIFVKVPNKIGSHIATLKSNYNLDGKKNKITSADISTDGKIIVLLNHDKVWKLTNYKNDDFFSGKIEKLSFEHDSQKEGVCFKTNTQIIITDERNGFEGGNIYSFKIN
ncbi:hypothetical protein [Winogradskyella sp. UBA3174]|uniref:hypothetical protein n=1 Tax=Winogradskyella sp. UBA3174 TaxID=1947785 RepID=UPI0025ED5857|nr:hypothetical protein [Winogradskyella sp. UBA3174]|tara:strand:+ start:44447 stop:45256 length:810 start_codon:yes stop_codon:yes gene_type:complete